MERTVSVAGSVLPTKGAIVTTTALRIQNLVVRLSKRVSCVSL